MNRFTLNSNTDNSWQQNVEVKSKVRWTFSSIGEHWNLSYMLALPPDRKIYHVLHISFLKNHVDALIRHQLESYLLWTN